MIDKIRINKIINIPPEAFKPTQWRCSKKPYHGVEKTKYTHKDNSIHITYSVESQRLVITGRLVALSVIDNKVSNLDELLQGAAGITVKQEHIDGHVNYILEPYAQDLPALMQQINTKLYDLLGINVDIGTFKVTYIEICFNVLTEYVNEYIQIFNKVFWERDPKRYKNYIMEMKEPSNTSFYIKSKRQFEKNKKRGFTINFYNKMNQLSKLLQERIRKANTCKRYQIRFKLEDMEGAQNVLRLEVQCSYDMLTRISESFGFDNKTREFNEFININLCRDIVVGRYLDFIGEGDFYTYDFAKKIIEESDLPKNEKNNLLNYILKAVRGHKVTTHPKYKKALRELGVHWCFIPKGWGVDRLESAIRLLERHVEEVLVNQSNMNRRIMAARLEADYHNDIEVEDDGTVLIDDGGNKGEESGERED